MLQGSLQCSSCELLRKDGKSMVRSRRSINQDILLLGEKGRRRGEPTSESTGDNPGQYADAR